MTVFDLKDGFQYAMHGNGAYKGLRQTNTEDALLYWYSKGIRVFEIDIAKTDDDQFVAVAHDLKDKSLRRLEILNPPQNRNADWFMRQKLFSVSTKGLKPLSLYRICNILKEKKDIIIMLDLFGMFSKEESSNFTKCLCEIVSEKSIESRLLIEAYNSEMVEGIKERTDKINIIYCARYENNYQDEMTVSSEELINNNIRFVSYPWYCSKKHPREIKKYSEHGITVFSRTKYNTKDDLLINSGVSVNLISYRFDGWRIIYQYPLYISTYLKRIVVKIYMKYRWR